jgi:hypothetical protein
LERKHIEEREIREIFALQPKCSERKRLIAMLRNEGNLDSGLRGQIIPKKRQFGIPEIQNDYVICIYCKAYYKRLALSRHAKKCFAKPFSDDQPNNKQRALIESVVFAASNRKYGDILNKSNLKEIIFKKMMPDDITAIALDDLIIVLYGEDL